LPVSSCPAAAHRRTATHRSRSSHRKTSVDPDTGTGSQPDTTAAAKKRESAAGAHAGGNPDPGSAEAHTAAPSDARGQIDTRTDLDTDAHGGAGEAYGSETGSHPSHAA
jgi:hypothetical protein